MGRWYEQWLERDWLLDLFIGAVVLTEKTPNICKWGRTISRLVLNFKIEERLKYKPLLQESHAFQNIFGEVSESDLMETDFVLLK